MVPPGEQRQLDYFSSDFKYRNDADIVAVRRGCTFTGFTGSSFNGERFTVTAGSADRWHQGGVVDPMVNMQVGRLQK